MMSVPDNNDKKDPVSNDDGHTSEREERLSSFDIGCLGGVPLVLGVILAFYSLLRLSGGFGDPPPSYIRPPLPPNHIRYGIPLLFVAPGLLGSVALFINAISKEIRPLYVVLVMWAGFLVVFILFIIVESVYS
jgi:hypothetical protein